MHQFLSHYKCYQTFHGSFLPSLLNIHRISPDTCDQLQSVTQNGKQGLHPPNLPSLGSWCTVKMKPEEKKLPPKSSNSQFFTTSKFKFPIATAKGEAATKGFTLIFSTIKRTQQTQKMLTTNSLHYIHLVNSFFLLFLPRTPINKFNYIERSTWISWWYFLD